MIRTLTLLLGAAAVVAVIDLIHKQRAISEQGGAVLLHDRPTGYVVAGAAMTLAWAGAIALTRSSLLAAPDRARPLRRLRSGCFGDCVARVLVGAATLGALALPGVSGGCLISCRS